MSGADQSILIVGEREPLLEALRQALEDRYDVEVEIATSSAAAQAAVAAAPDLVLLVGDAVGDGGSDVLQRFASSPMASVVPVVLLADDANLDERLQALKFGATAVIPRSASVDEIARRVVELMSEVPERSGRAFGELGETTLEEFVGLLGKELRSGILSVRGSNDDPSQSVRFVLGEGQNVQKLIQEFVQRVGSMVSQADTLQYEFEEHPGGQLQLVSGEDDGPAAEGELSGLRVMIADSDPVRADTIAQDLRARGVNAFIADLTGRRLDQLRSTDPSVLIIGEQELRGSGYELVRKMREDSRLRWAFLLVVAWDEIWGEESPQPTTDELIAKLTALAEPEHTLRMKASQGKPFDTRVEILGPARLLRTLASHSSSLRASIRHWRGTITIDITEGLIVGAKGKLSGEQEREGPEALSAVLGMTSGRVHVEPVEHPASTNIMSTPDVAFELAGPAASLTSSNAESRISAPKGVQHVASAKTGNTNRPPTAAQAQPEKPPAPKAKRRAQSQTLVGVGAAGAADPSGSAQDDAGADAGAKAQAPPPPPPPAAPPPPAVAAKTRAPQGEGSTDPAGGTSAPSTAPAQTTQPAASAPPAAPAHAEAPAQPAASARAEAPPPVEVEGVEPDPGPGPMFPTDPAPADDKPPEDKTQADAPFPEPDPVPRDSHDTERPPASDVEKFFPARAQASTGPGSDHLDPAPQGTSPRMAAGQAEQGPMATPAGTPMQELMRFASTVPAKWWYALAGAVGTLLILSIVSAAVGGGGEAVEAERASPTEAAGASPSSPRAANGPPGEAKGSEPDPEAETDSETVADEPGAEAAATNEEADADGTAQGASEDDTGSDKSGSDESDSQAPSSDSPKDADEYVNTDPDIPDHIRKMSGRERHLRAAKLRDLAGRLLRHDSYEKSEKWWRRAWKYDPKAPETAAGLARTLVHSGREEEGLAWGRHALDLSGGSGRYHAVMGELLFKTGDLEGAIESYEVAAQRKPDSPRIRRRLRNLRHARDN